MQTTEGPPAPDALAALRARATEAVRFQPREIIALAVLAVVVVAGAAAAYVRARPVPAGSLVPIEAPAPTPTVAAPQHLWVHVVGAVAKPGVYRFDVGARVFEALREAGGATRRADLARVNLARVLSDGEQVVVPRKGEAAPAGAATGSGGAPGGKLNINTAGARELESLPGIGPVLAQRIVDYRDQHGPFGSTRDLMKVSGIGPKTFESIEPHITV